MKQPQKLETENVGRVASNAGLDVQTAPFDLLCGCVSVLISDTEEDRFKHMRPDMVESFVHGYIRSGKRDRYVLTDCETCNGTGLVV